MARSTRGMPGLYIDADMRELAHATGVIEKFTRTITTNAHLKTVTNAIHATYSQEFDRHMANVAKISKENYHHLYEYSSTGGGYDNVGKQSMQLWTHTIRSTPGAAVNFSWQWLPAKNYNPTYRQRRMGRVGHDAMRNIPKEQFDTLVAKSKNRRYKFVWKAPMLEYGIQPEIWPVSGETLAVPVHEITSPRLREKRGSGPNLLFLGVARPEHNAPGPTMGNFTAMWTWFWGQEVPSRMKKEFNEIVERDAAKNIKAAIRAGKAVPKARSRTFSFTAVKDYNEAYAAGQEQAVAAIVRHQRSIKGIEKMRGSVINRGLET